LARGLSPQELAEAFGVGASTIKTHIKHIFAKTGVTRQGDLIRLMATMTPPVRF
jgi:DNA-binding CsgD family transcriptional regulator